jgi:hypothetical protein
MGAQLNAIEGDEQQAQDPHHAIDDVLHDKNRLPKMVGRSIKMAHLLIGHDSLDCARIGYSSSHIQILTGMAVGHNMA